MGFYELSIMFFHQPGHYKLYGPTNSTAKIVRIFENQSQLEKNFVNLLLSAPNANKIFQIDTNEGTNRMPKTVAILKKLDN